MRPWAFTAPLIVLSLSLAGCASSPRVSRLAEQIEQRLPDCAAGAVQSDHSVEIDGKAVKYHACAGTLTVTDADGSALGNIFYTAYLAGKAEENRPLTFIWNGGPGADSRLLHFHALGPRVLEDGVLVDNDASPLNVSDLVFVDPAGTGFSRAIGPEEASTLYSTVGDIAATSDFIQRFRSAYGRDKSKLFLVGESFGTWRASGVAETLEDEGTRVTGIGLISGGIPLGEIKDRALMRALSLPNRTATALALDKLPPTLQLAPESAMAQSENWARKIWYPALRDPDALSLPRKIAVIAGLMRYQGLSPAQIDTKTLWVSPKAFREGLLADQGKVLDVFDMRQVMPTETEENSAKADQAVIAYYRDTLGYQLDEYAGIDTAPLPVGDSWQYDQSPITRESLARAMAGEGPPSPSQPWTRRVMEKNRDLRVWVAAGLYDSLNSCAANEATIANLAPQLAERFTLKCYAGGHMMYEAEGQRQPFDRDIAAFLAKD
ncbi:S10 family serine carboxypeptidase-like protein [Altericroceibacterium endophyticum]|uniref:Peptidase S10 n=1 Tax=Altericroceibacterium endophyticum TaxID=1808508 RepID=A0A6I4T6S8_9SPHN|nr:peptidase S10 [Altericroceibacterium endophyticum]MXO66169.1 peptidase S10 [Altericroceibacterium endophyticum]